MRLAGCLTLSSLVGGGMDEGEWNKDATKFYGFEL